MKEFSKKVCSRFFRNLTHISAVALLLTVAFIPNTARSQTKGLIFKPATGAGKTVLDPNGDGYTSASTNGFTSNDQAQSEIPYVAIPVPSTEPTSDLGPGPDCGFTDFVDSGSEDPALFYYDGTNLLFRMRMGASQPNSKGYSVLIDTDQKFGFTGPNADPNATINNPGFEIEVSLQTNFGVYVYNVDGSCPGAPSTSLTGEQYYQKSIAYTTNCGDADYFYDFYIPFSALTSLGVTSSTAMRMVIITTMNPNAAICNNAQSDIGGIDDSSCGGTLAGCADNIINNFPPTTITGINTPGLDRSTCPFITAPISSGATSVSGTSVHSSGTITVYKNGSAIGTTSISSGMWTLSGISALTSGDVITADARATGMSTSIANCDAVTVAQTCTSSSSLTVTACNAGKAFSGTGTAGAQIRLYYGTSTTALTPSSGSTYSSGTITVASDGSWLWRCVGSGQTTSCTAGGGPCLADGVYRITQTLSGQCESNPIYICIGSTTSTSTPSITTSPILTTTTSVSGTSVSGANIILLANGKQIATGTASGTSWTISGLSLTLGQVITAQAITGTNCLSSASSSVAVSTTSSAPTITGTYCTSSTITSVTGTSTDASGTLIQVYKNGIAHGSTTTVDGNGNWTASSGISLSAGDVITAKSTVSGGSPSGASSSVTVGSKTASTAAITTSPIYEGGTSVSGTGTNGNTIALYVDGIQMGSATVSSGNWVVSGLGSYDLYTGGVVTVSAIASGQCEGASSASVTIQCVAPSTSLTVNPSSENICPGTTAPVTVVNSTNYVVYQLYNGASPSGSSVLGTGSNIALTSATLSANTTLSVKAIKIGGSSCASTLSQTVAVTVSGPTTPTVGTQTTNDITPAISGTTGTGAALNSGEILTVAINGAIYTVTPNASGNWTVDTGTATPTSGTVGTFSNGTYSVTATVTKSGCSSADATSNELTIDTIAPAVPTVESQTTNDSTPVITGTATVNAGETLTVIVNGVTYTVGDGNLTLTGTTWSLQIPNGNAIADGTYSVTAKVTDAANNSSTDVTNNELTIDTVAPAVPTVESQTTNDSTPVITGTATVHAGETLTVVVNGVTYTVGDGNFTLTGTTWSLQIPNGNAIADGTYSVTAKVTDAASNYSIDATSNELTIDTIAPAVPTVVSQTTNDNTPVITGTATVNAGETLTVVVNGVTYTVGDGNFTLTGTTWSLQIPNGNAIADGTYSVTAKVTDAANNSSTDVTNNELTIDTVAPAVPTVESQTTNDSTPVITGTATVHAGETLTVVVNGVTYTVGDGNFTLTGTTWSLQIPNANQLSDAIYSVRASVTDAAGNISNDLTANELVIYTSNPPATPIAPPATPIAPTVTSQITNDNTPVITGMATVNAGETLTVTVNGVTYIAGDGHLVLAGSTWSLTIPNGNALPDGTHSITAKVTNSAGTFSTDATSNELTIDTVPPAVPTVTSLNTNSNTPTITGIAILNAGETLTVTVNGVTYAVGDGHLTLTGSTWSLTIPNGNALSYGTYSIAVRVTDAAGNFSDDTTSNELVISKPNNPPTAENALVALAEKSSAGTLVFTVVASDPDAGDVLAYSISSGNANSAFAIDAAAGAITVANSSAIDAASNPVFTLVVKVTDSKGNSTTATIIITINHLDTNNKIKPTLGFSPDGDGINETWTIENIEKYPNNEVTIFNRWGNEVYHASGYDNSERAWAGYGNGRWTIATTQVPDGTYFYVINLGDGSKPLGGYIVLKR